MKHNHSWYALFIGIIISSSFFNHSLVGEGFVQGTLVCTPSGYIPIEELSIGDEVITCDFNYGYTVEPIADITHHDIACFTRITIGTTTIDVASDHTFFAPFKQKWIQASELVEGDCLLGAPLNDEYVDSIERYEQTISVYNISLGKHHNYLVSEDTIMVHNFAETAYLSFAIAQSATGTTVLNAFLLAHPAVAPVTITVGALALTGYVAKTFWNAFKAAITTHKNETPQSDNYHTSSHQESNKPHNNPPHKNSQIQNEHLPIIKNIPKNDVLHGTCGTAQQQDNALLNGSCLSEPRKNSEISLCPDPEAQIEQNNCNTESQEPGIEVRPCGYQGQSLPGFGSDDANKEQEKDVRNELEEKELLDEPDVYADMAIESIKQIQKLLQNSELSSEQKELLHEVIRAYQSQDIVSFESIAIFKNGYYEVNGFKFTKYYYEKLWSNGRPAPSLLAAEILKEVKKISPDYKHGFFRYETDCWEMIFNPATKEVHHMQQIIKKSRKRHE